MKELQRRQYLRRLLYSYPSILLLIVVCFLLAKGAVGIIKIERESANKVYMLEQEALSLSLRENILKQEIEKLKSDEGIIEEIREKFSVAREGEHIAIIVDEKAKDISAEDSLSWYKKLWNAIINIR